MQVTDKPQRAHPNVPADLQPGRVFVTLDEELDNFERESRRFRGGEAGLGDEFRPFRLMHGVYGQRQENTQMIRVKLPYGGVSADQMEACAVFAEKYSGYRRGHITTRENFQFHFVNLDDVPEVLRLLAGVGLTTREACGNTVRNVPGRASPAPPFHALGFIARVRRENGREVRGFEIRIGGGLSTMPRQADTIFDFVPVENGEDIRASGAMIQGFAPEGPTPGDPPRNGHQPSAELQRWLETNVRRQRQEGYVAVTVTVPMGNLSPEQFRGLAQVMRRFSGGTARTQQNQNLVLRWGREDSLPAPHAELPAIGLGAGEAGLIADVVACPGTDSCQLGITSSQGAGYALRDAVLEMGIDDPLVHEITIKVSGCPNGCAQHHLATIGLQGSAFKAGGVDMPCYDAFLGGGNYLGGGKYGPRVARVPVKPMPQAIAKIIQTYQAERGDEERFLDYIDRVGPKYFHPILSA